MSEGRLESLETKESKGTLGPTDHLVNPGNRAFVYACYISQISIYNFNIRIKNYSNLMKHYYYFPFCHQRTKKKQQILMNIQQDFVTFFVAELVSL